MLPTSFLPGSVGAEKSVGFFGWPSCVEEHQQQQLLQQRLQQQLLQHAQAQQQSLQLQPQPQERQPQPRGRLSHLGSGSSGQGSALGSSPLGTRNRGPAGVRKPPAVPGVPDFGLTPEMGVKAHATVSALLASVQRRPPVRVRAGVCVCVCVCVRVRACM